MSEVALSTGMPWAKGFRLLVQSFEAHWFCFVVPALYLLTDVALIGPRQTFNQFHLFDLARNTFLISLGSSLLILLIARKAQAGIDFIARAAPTSADQAAPTTPTTARRLVNGLPVLVAMIMFNKAVVELRPAIPTINPFEWDVTLAKFDRILHGGVEPWVLLQPVFGHPAMTLLLSFAYSFWFVVLAGSWVWFAFQAQSDELRTRFFLSYMLIWWIGGILAVQFSSAGPCYYAKLGLVPDPFGGLMDYLTGLNQSLPIWSVSGQNMLWNGYIGKAEAVGISAFPSMHNGSAALFALAFNRVSRAWGRIFVAYAAVILAGSVHLGWHYAIDGYAAIALAILCWHLSAPVVRWVNSLSITKRYNENLRALAS